MAGPDPVVVQRWLRARPGFAAAEVLSLDPVDEGYSNETFRVSLSGAPHGAVGLRLQPQDGIFAPYDVVREGRVVGCLAATDVPVPAVVGSEPDPGVLGRPFLVLEWVDAPHLGAEGIDLDHGAFTAALLGVHRADWEAAGLAFLGVPHSPAAGFAGEVELVAARMAAWGLDDDPLLALARDALRACTPAGGALALCHGDANVFNYLTRDGRIVAVVDWEQARISDPRSDVGQLEALTVLNGMPFSPADEGLFTQMYRAAGGEAEAMAPFRALWFFQLGFVHRAFTRLRAVEPWYTWAQIEQLLPLALDELAGGG